MSIAVAIAAPATALSLNLAPEQKYVLGTIDANGDIVTRVITESERAALATGTDGGYQGCTGDSPNTPGCSVGPLYWSWGWTFGFTLPIPSGFTSPAGNVKVHQEQVVGTMTGSRDGNIQFGCDFKETPNSATPSFKCFLIGSPNYPTPGQDLKVDFYAWLLTTGGTGEKTRTVLGPAGVVLPGLGQYNAFLATY